MAIGWSVISPAAMRVIYAHVVAYPDVEVGGFIVGTFGDSSDEPICTAAIEAYAARGNLTRLTFTHDVWEHVHRVLEDEHPGSSIVGWYHSHPGHGVFLSEHDRFIHRHFFSARWQVAVVVDPLQRTEGIFGWADDKIVPFSTRALDDSVPVCEVRPGFTSDVEVTAMSAADRARVVVELEDETYDDRQPHDPERVVLHAAEDPSPPPPSWDLTAEPEPALAGHAKVDALVSPLAGPRRPESYPIAGHVLPIMAGFGVGVAVAVALAL